MTETRFTQDHEWVRLDGAEAIIGITDHAQSALGDVVFVELPEPGRKVAAAEAWAVVEGVIAASDISAPLAGGVSETNPALTDDPALVNKDPEGKAWFFKLRLDDPAAFTTLMDAAAYADLVKSL